MYCERCSRLFEGDVCPECRKKGREPQAEDSCFLLSVGQIWADMACDILKQNEIPYLKQGRMGAGMSMLTGIPLETYSLYVPYSDYEKAREITDVLADSEESADEEGEAYDFDPEQEHEEEEES